MVPHDSKSDLLLHTSLNKQQCMRQMEVVMIANIGQEDLNLCAHVFDRVQEFNSMRISLAPIENSRSPRCSLRPSRISTST